VVTVSSSAQTADDAYAELNSPARTVVQPATRKFAEAALANDKREGLGLAVRARWIALAIIAVLLPILNPTWDIVYYLAGLGLFALIGWVQLKVGKAGVSRLELALMFCDLALLTVLCVVPNPWSTVDWPLAMQFRLDNFLYFFILLSGATLAYSWRTVVAMGTWTAGLWIVGIVWAYCQPVIHPELSERIRAAVGTDIHLFQLLDPSSFNIGDRVREIIVFLIVAMTLALTVRRSSQLLMRHAALERERTNLARYFSPNVVEELSRNDEPLKQVRTQNVAVMFADIVGFTAYADGRHPADVIGTLRQFHGRMEQEVFRHNGTLDKYLGDGLMATFGTPFVSEADAGNALRCAQAMMSAIDEMNRERSGGAEPPIQVSLGLHYGQVVLGDIGLNRLEFAVIGTTVNAASRLESLTRSLGCTLVASDDLVRQARAETASSSHDFMHLVAQPAQMVRGLEHPVAVWTRAGNV
jgi:adenylate cyclase